MQTVVKSEQKLHIRSRPVRSIRSHFEEKTSDLKYLDPVKIYAIYIRHHICVCMGALQPKYLQHVRERRTVKRRKSQ